MRWGFPTYLQLVQRCAKRCAWDCWCRATSCRRLVGPNGAGKTTLLHMAVGLLAPSAGRINVLDGPPPREMPDQLRRIGFVAPDKPLYRGFRVGEMLRLGALLNPGWDAELVGRRM